MANHLRLDLDLVELLAGVDADDAADHLGDDNHVTEVGLDEVGLLVGPGLLLGLAELLDQTHGLALETAVEPATGTGVDDIAELLGGEVEEPGYSISTLPQISCNPKFDILVKVDATVGKLAEGSLLLELCTSPYCQPYVPVPAWVRPNRVSMD